MVKQLKDGEALGIDDGSCFFLRLYFQLFKNILKDSFLFFTKRLKDAFIQHLAAFILGITSHLLGGVIFHKIFFDSPGKETTKSRMNFISH